MDLEQMGQRFWSLATVAFALSAGLALCKAWSAALLVSGVFWATILGTFADYAFWGVIVSITVAALDQVAQMYGPCDLPDDE